jgi:hypothetical protein
MLIGDCLDYTNTRNNATFIRSVLKVVSGFGILNVWHVKQRHLNGLYLLHVWNTEKGPITRFCIYKYGK